MQLEEHTRTQAQGGAFREQARLRAVSLSPEDGGAAREADDHEAATRSDAPAAIADDPVLQAFYERVVPADITPAAWMPFWPSAWREHS